MSVKNEDKTIVNCTNNFYNSKYNNDSFSYSKNDLTIENDYDYSDDEGKNNSNSLLLVYF